jgi:alkylhydroperoxidase/carboxymuconolactone decarboxylase family protein YurZ
MRRRSASRFTAMRFLKSQEGARDCLESHVAHAVRAQVPQETASETVLGMAAAHVNLAQALHQTEPARSTYG